MSKALFVPLHVDGLQLSAGMDVVSPFADFTRLPYVAAAGGGQQVHDANSSVPWITESVAEEPMEAPRLKLEAGVHLHWALPDALTKATHPVGADGKRDRSNVAFPAVPNRWLVVRRVAGVAQKRWLIESDYLWPADHPWGSIPKDAFTADLGIQGKAIWERLIACGWLVAARDNSHTIVVDEHDRLSNDLGPYHARRAEILRVLHERGLAPGRTANGLVSYPFPNTRADSRPVPGLPPFRYLGRKRVLGEPWSQQGPAEYLKDIGHKLTAIGYGEPTFASFYPNCRSVFGFHDAIRTSAHSHHYDVYGWYSEADDDVLSGFVVDPDARAPDGTPQTEDQQFAAWLETRFSWTTDDGPAGTDHTSIVCYGRLRADSFIKPNGTRVNAHIAPAVRINDAPAGYSLDKAIVENRSDVHVAVANTGTEALSAYLADRMAWQRHPGDGHARAAEKRKIEDYLEALQMTDDLEHKLLDVGASFAEKRHDKSFTAGSGGSVWVIRARADAAPAANVTKNKALDEVSLPAGLAHRLNTLNAAQRAYEHGCRSIEAMRWQVYSDWTRYMRNVYPPDDEALDYKSARDNHDVDITIAYLRDGGLAVLDQLIEDTGELVKIDSRSVAESAAWKLAEPATPSSLASKLKGQIEQVAAGVERHNARIRSINPPASKATAAPRVSREMEANETRWILEQVPAPRFYRPNDPVVLLAGDITSPTDRHGEDGRRHTKGHLECQTLEGPALDLPALRTASSDDGREAVDRAAVALDALANRLMNTLEQSRPSRIGFRRRQIKVWHPFMLEWQVQIAPVRSGGNMPSIGRRFDPGFIRTNWSLDENDCTFAETDNLTTRTDSCSILRGRGFFTSQARGLLRQRLEIYLKWRLKDYFSSCGVDRDRQTLEYLRQNYTAVRAWFVKDGATTQAVADGLQLDKLQKASIGQRIHGISSDGAIAQAILTAVNRLPASTLQDTVGLDQQLVMSIVVRRSGPALLGDGAAVLDDKTRSAYLNRLKLEADLREAVTDRFSEFLDYVFGVTKKAVFVAGAGLDDRQANRLPEPELGFAALVETLRTELPVPGILAATAEDAETDPPHRFTSLLELNSLKSMQGNDAADGAAAFARIIRFADYSDFFVATGTSPRTAEELPSVFGLPAGGPIEAGVLKLVRDLVKESEASGLVQQIGIAANVMRELRLAAPIRSLFQLSAVPLVGSGVFARLLHHADRSSNYIEMRADAPAHPVEHDEIGARFAARARGGHAWSDPILTAIDAWYALNSGFDGVSQALTGFNDALLMRRRGWQLPVADPLTFTEYQAFSDKTIRAAVGRQTYSPVPPADFHPIRSGDMEITKLRLVDTFGQARDIAINDVVTTNRMHTDRRLGVALPPRITQPARLNFRWLDADVGEQEWNQHPASTPICGWLVLNSREARLMIFDGDGAPLGSVDQMGAWRMPPGPRGGVSSPDDIANYPLSHMVKWLCHEASIRQEPQHSFIDKFVDLVGSALANINPEAFRHRGAKTLLTGRPLALVRAAVSLECREPFAVQQSLEAFGRELSGQARTTDNFEHVRFPVRIGEHMQLNDGVVGYWPEEGQDYAQTYRAADSHGSRVAHLGSEIAGPLARLGSRLHIGRSAFLEAVAGVLGPELSAKHQHDICNACAAGRDFFAPQSEWLDDENLEVYRDGKSALNLWLPLTSSANPQIVSVLIDPRGSLHATCGVLPTKKLDIPPEMYAPALAALDVSFLTAPLMSARGRVNAALPREDGLVWSWVANRDGHWSTTPAVPVIEKSAFHHAFGTDDGETIWRLLIEKNWLTAFKGRQDEASVPVENPSAESKTQADTSPPGALTPADGNGSTAVLRNGRHAAELGDFASRADAILRVIELESRAIGRVSTHAHFAEQELLEGWFVLSPLRRQDAPDVNADTGTQSND